MKLCNYRWPRNAEGRCTLNVDEVSGRKPNYLSPHVFAPEGELPTHYTVMAFVCKDAMASVCPYRIHIPRGPRDPTEWIQCEYCGHRHRTEQAVATCKGYHEWYKALGRFKKEFKPTGFLPEGTTEEVYPPDVIGFKGFANVRAHIWPWMNSAIIQRDGGRCQDCGTQEGQFEVHHIIPRAKGGTDHPANLKLVCWKCHRKYTDELLGELGPIRAKQNRINKVKQVVPKSLEEFA